MIEGENEKNPLFAISLETLKTDIYFTSDGYLCHKICFHELNFQSPISRQDFSYYFPVNKVANGKKYFEKEIKIKITGYDRDGYDQDGFNRKGFDSNGFNINGIDEHGFTRKKELACEKKLNRP